VNLGPARGESCALRVAALRVGVKRPEIRGPRAGGRAQRRMGAAWQSMFYNRDGLAARGSFAEAASGALDAASGLF